MNRLWQKPSYVHDQLRKTKFSKAADIVSQGIEETLQYTRFLDEYWRHIRTNSPLERIKHKIRRKTRVVGSFPDGNSALMLVAARLRHIAGTHWGTRKDLNTDHLKAIWSTSRAHNMLDATLKMSCIAADFLAPSKESSP